MKNILIALCLGLYLSSCQTVDVANQSIDELAITNGSSKEEDQDILSRLLTRIQALSTQEVCTTPADWKFTALGTKACGGAEGYIGYSKRIDEESFLQLVDNYTEQQDKFNNKWSVISDCSITPQPRQIDCVDGHVVFVY